MVKEFKAFLMQGSLITLAVAFVMGAAFAALLTSFVGDMIMPLIGAIFGKTDFSALTFTIHHSVFHWGSFLNAVITFVTIALAVFLFVVKPYEAVTARTKKAEEEAGPTNEERMVQLLEQIAAK
jgi:large conductance mechanosensitive channel